MRQIHLGMVTDGNGKENPNRAYLTVGSDRGDEPEDCEIELVGTGAAELARAIAAIPFLVDAIEQALSDMDEDGHSVCEDTKILLRNALEMAQEAPPVAPTAPYNANPTS